ncbi:MAG: phage holin family protein, partial [Myxococcales bacterium]
LALAGLLVLLAAAVAGLALVIPVWAAALVVGGVVLAVGYALVMKGMGALQHLDPVPERTVQTMKDNQTWVKEQMP